jgi:diguanylate cyclase (GGDEF)-like protein
VILKKLSFDTLGSRILILSIAAVLAVSLTVLITMWVTMVRHAQQKSTEDIDRAKSVLTQVLQQRSKQLLASAEVLTGDFGFKQAVATHDTATIASALDNHGARIEADLMLLLNLQGTVTASSKQAQLPDAKIFAAANWLDSALKQGVAVSYANIQQAVYQIILLPIKAPRPIALAAVGFKIDSKFTDQLYKMTGTHVSLVAVSAGQRQVLATTLPAAQLEMALNAPAEIDSHLSYSTFDKQPFLTRSLTISEDGGSRVDILLSVDLLATFAQYDLLRETLLWVNLITLLLSVLGAIFVARSLSTPLAKLERAVKKVAKGQQDKLPEIGSSTREIKSLFLAFDSMQTDLRTREDKIIYQANHDHLTKLYNRKHFIQGVDSYIKRTTESLAIANINIKAFKRINDTFGPMTGDQCLKLVAKRLQGVAGNEQLAARSGADEFFLALPLPADTDIEDLFAVVVDQIGRNYVFDGLNLSLQFNIGVVVYPAHGVDAAHLLRRSTIALDHARSENQGLCVYQDGEEEALQDKLTLLEDLKNAFAVNNGQLRMNYQPKQHLSTGKIDKCEALIRWIHPQRGFVSPELFVALAEQSGLINTLTDWVVEAVINDIYELSRHDVTMHVAINISAQDLERTDLIDKIDVLLKVKNISPTNIILELTERDMMNDVDKAMLLMQKYKQQGFQLSVDDYGIGQSSLSKLKQMPVDEIKIDKSFVMQLNESESDKIIVKSTIELGHNFQLRVIAEGVENEQSMELLREMGCDYMQGYYLARPMPLEDLIQWMAEKNQQQNTIAG